MALDNLMSRSDLHKATSESLAKYKTDRQLLDRILADGRAAGLPPQDRIPDPALFNNWGILDRGRLPSTAECAAHLQLLHVFRALQLHLARSTFGWQFGARTPADKLRVYATLAAVRFLVWCEGGHRAPSGLPPVDVLMVWHSFLLNAQLFRDAFSGKPLYSVPFPWRLVHYCSVDSGGHWALEISKDASDAFTRATKTSCNLFDEIVKQYDVAAERSRYTLRDDGLYLAQEGRVNPLNGSLDVYCRATISVDRALVVKLRDAVVRQISFSEKMAGLLWIRSPTLADTIRRATERYDRFLRLFGQLPDEVLVPTLDIDLVWHTHQCWPESYDQGARERAGRFIDHDDAMADDTLSRGRRLTSDMYSMVYGEQYNVCGCWECQALITEIENPILVTDGTPADMDAIVKRVERRVAYYHAVEASRK